MTVQLLCYFVIMKQNSIPKPVNNCPRTPVLMNSDKVLIQLDGFDKGFYPQEVDLSELLEHF